MPNDEKERLLGNIRRHLGQTSKEIQLRQLVQFYHADPA
jgi:catalase